jgi:hypothetical protein
VRLQNNNLLDIRFAKIFKIGGTRLEALADVSAANLVVSVFTGTTGSGSGPNPSPADPYRAASSGVALGPARSLRCGWRPLS